MKLAPVCALALAATASAASAATLTTSDVVTDIVLADADTYAGTFSFDKFDPSLGALTSATLNFTYNYLSVGPVFDIGGSGGTATAESQMGVEFKGGAGSVLEENVFDASATFSTAFVGAYGSTTMTNSETAVAGPYFITDHAAITGTDAFTIDYELLMGTLVSGSGMTSGGFTNTGGLLAAVEYTFVEGTTTDPGTGTGTGGGNTTDPGTSGNTGGGNTGGGSNPGTGTGTGTGGSDPIGGGQVSVVPITPALPLLGSAFLLLMPLRKRRG